jgi:Flp pilus assembly protein protease CpaA
MNTLTIILVILLVFAVLGGGYSSATYGWAGWSPAGLLLVILLILFLTGRL